MLLLYLIAYIYIWLFDLYEFLEGKNIYIIKLVKLLEWLLKALIINPYLIAIHKFYFVLYIWLNTPLNELIWKRIYGTVIAVLIFSPILNYIYILFGSILLVIYVMLVILNLSYDYSLQIGEIK